MTISFNGLLAECYHFISAQIASLSALQSKVRRVAFAYFSCTPVGYLIYGRQAFEAQPLNEKLEKEQPETSTSKHKEFLPDEESPEERIARLEARSKRTKEVFQQASPGCLKEHLSIDCSSNVIAENVISSPLRTPVTPFVDSRHQEIEERLEKNRNYARIQQEQQGRKGFNVIYEGKPRSRHPFIVEPEKEMGNGRAAMASCQGLRPTMEDETLIAPRIPLMIKEKTYYADVCAVFDGHAGRHAATFAQKHLIRYLTKELEHNNPKGLNDVGIWDALKKCCQKLDEDFPGSSGGTTAAIVLILEGKIWVANVGDSRVILERNGKTTQASEDAKVDIERYRKKIYKDHGVIYEGRVNGRLAVARAIGDKNVKGAKGKCCVSSHPKITNYPLKDYEGGHLVIACDGLYDAASSDEVGVAVHRMAELGESPSSIAIRLVDGAIRNRSKDNVSVIVMKL